MTELTESSRSFLEGLGINPATFFSTTFKPTCWYDKQLDWFFFLSRDCSYVATRTSDPHVELLKDEDETVGMKIMWFSRLPRELRDAFMRATGVDPDDIVGIEAIMLHNVEESLPKIEAAESAFFRELRWRENHFRYEALYESGFPTTAKRHERVMAHLGSLNPARLPG